MGDTGMGLNAQSRGWLCRSGIASDLPRKQNGARWRNGACLTARRALLLFLAGALGVAARAQEAIRMSLAGDSAVQSGANISPDSYNLHVGDTLWRFVAGLGLSYDDNINLVASGRESDFIISPRVDTSVLWPVTDHQSLSLSLGAGYSEYTEHSSYSRPFITPNSGLSYNIFAGDFRINLHDRFSIDENSYLDPTVAGNGDLSEFQNSAGIGVLWDLNKLIVNVGYDHSDYVVLTGGQGEPNRTSDIFSASAGYTLKPAMVAGLEAGGGLMHNSISIATANSPFADVTQWNVGPFFQTRITDYLQFSIHGGYAVSQSDAAGSASPATTSSGFYGLLNLNHRVNGFLDYTLSGGRSLNASLSGGFVDLYKAEISANWKIFLEMTLTTGFLYQNGTQLLTGLGESFDQYGPLVRLGRLITRKWSASLLYQHLQRDSDQPGRSYFLNDVTVEMSRQF